MKIIRFIEYYDGRELRKVTTGFDGIENIAMKDSHTAIVTGWLFNHKMKEQITSNYIRYMETEVEDKRHE
ncbi:MULTISPECIES: hypothetical protein [Lentilactobacillus]|uniref:Uncharacterized protein n=1 Tax=Lentilactobacillus parafarraginis DSM 18390 = JCM 14109 TaxID=1423786 RepID=A0A0R1YI30_9LACO|nr:MULTISPECIES: hypothetical protein [Lentilactobacillus]KRM41850.1 hypothetical protein FD47_GL002194 [Lentilactobacillus parafarraginis DSM 18390 = JCM 14109]TJY08521.1 hypothetical protein FCF15_11185 [Lentilactobacillus buchneri]GED94091.1 hypothetical protein LBSP_06510 [Lentilactobacillus buchneri subsp. silagei]